MNDELLVHLFCSGVQLATIRIWLSCGLTSGIEFGAIADGSVLTQMLVMVGVRALTLIMEAGGDDCFAQMDFRISELIVDFQRS
jgi:hypothetical protein